MASLSRDNPSRPPAGQSPGAPLPFVLHHCSHLLHDTKNLDRTRDGFIESIFFALAHTYSSRCASFAIFVDHSHKRLVIPGSLIRLLCPMLGFEQFYPKQAKPPSGEPGKPTPKGADPQPGAAHPQRGTEARPTSEAPRSGSANSSRGAGDTGGTKGEGGSRRHGGQLTRKQLEGAMEDLGVSASAHRSSEEGRAHGLVA